MGTATSTVIDNTSSYIWGDMSEVSLPFGQTKKFILKSALKFIYVKEGDHYKLSPNTNWTTDKFIQDASILRIFKIFRHGDGHIQIFASFDGETGLYDVSGLFDAVSPLQIKTAYLHDLSISSPQIPKPSVYDKGGYMCGFPLKTVSNNDTQLYSKSL
uniref:Uncharacterized protein n=1 Tax=Marseillevirus LCMAC101 TaxID=2506602 RepID=A0A481YSL9_9VIRU|nr:MAG: hypothetical protein LCMAC101_05320 [Marseillevirus LCMAC101]